MLVYRVSFYSEVQRKGIKQYGNNNRLCHPGPDSGLGAIAGASESFLSKNKAKSADAKLARWTKWVAIAFMVLTLVLCLLPS